MLAVLDDSQIPDGVDDVFNLPAIVENRSPFDQEFTVGAGRVGGCYRALAFENQQTGRSRKVIIFADQVVEAASGKFFIAESGQLLERLVDADCDPLAVNDIDTVVEVVNDEFEEFFVHGILAFRNARAQCAGIVDHSAG